MPTQTLTDARCRAAKPGAKLIKMFDGGGLHLAVLPSGVKVWRIAYRLNGKPKTISVGPYPDVSLAQARTKLTDVKAVLRYGGDPMAQRSVRRGPGLTIEQGCRAYWAGRGDISKGYRDNALRAMQLHVFPFIGNVPVRGATRKDLMNVLDRMDAAKKHVYLRKVRMWLGLMFDWAIAMHDAEINPASQIDVGRACGLPSACARCCRCMRQTSAQCEREDGQQGLASCSTPGNEQCRVRPAHASAATGVDAVAHLDPSRSTLTLWVRL